MSEQNVPTTQPVNPAKRTTGNNRGLTQAYELRDLAANEAKALGAEACSDLEDRCARAKALQALTAVWLGASDRIRILRGRPLPGSKRPAPEKPKAHKTSAFTPPTEEP